MFFFVFCVVSVRKGHRARTTTTATTTKATRPTDRRTDGQDRTHPWCREQRAWRRPPAPRRKRRARSAAGRARRGRPPAAAPAPTAWRGRRCAWPRRGRRRATCWPFFVPLVGWLVGWSRGEGRVSGRAAGRGAMDLTARRQRVRRRGKVTHSRGAAAAAAGVCELGGGSARGALPPRRPAPRGTGGAGRAEEAGRATAALARAFPESLALSLDPVFGLTWLGME